jgi:hypothetical protein
MRWMVSQGRHRGCPPWVALFGHLSLVTERKVHRILENNFQKANAVALLFAASPLLFRGICGRIEISGTIEDAGSRLKFPAHII